MPNYVLVGLFIVYSLILIGVGAIGITYYIGYRIAHGAQLTLGIEARQLNPFVLGVRHVRGLAQTVKIS